MFVLLSLVWGTMAFATGEPPQDFPREVGMFGRLFTSPEERHILDRMRLGLPVANLPIKKADPTQVVNTVVAGPRYVVVTGMMMNENHAKAVWLNGKLLPPGDVYKGEGFIAFTHSMDQHGLPISSTDSTRIFHLKAGEVMDFVDNRVRTAYEVDPQALASARREPPPPKEAVKPTSQAKSENTTPQPEHDEPAVSEKDVAKKKLLQELLKK